MSASSLPSSPVTSLPFIRRLFVSDPSAMAPSHPHPFHPEYRRHSFDAGTVVWTDRRSSALSVTSASTSPTASPTSPSSSASYSLSAASSPSYNASPLPPPPQLSGVDAFDLSASTPASRTPLSKKPSKLLEKLCKYEWDFS